MEKGAAITEAIRLSGLKKLKDTQDGCNSLFFLDVFVTLPTGYGKLNQCFKNVLRNLGANVNSHSIVRASKSIGVVQKVCSTFEDELHHKKRQLPIKLHLMGKILKSSSTLPSLDHNSSVKWKKRLLCSIDKG